MDAEKCKIFAGLDRRHTCVFKHVILKTKMYEVLQKHPAVALNKFFLVALWHHKWHSHTICC